MQSGSEILQLRVENENEELVADVVFSNMQDRQGKYILVVRDQNTYHTSLRRKRLMTVMQLYLISRYSSHKVHYVTPNDLNRIQTEKMKAMGIYDELKEEIGDIIVSRVDRDFVHKMVLDPGEHSGNDQDSGEDQGSHGNGPLILSEILDARLTAG